MRALCAAGPLIDVSELLERNGEIVDAQALTLQRAYVGDGGPDAALVTSDGPAGDACAGAVRRSGGL